MDLFIFGTQEFICHELSGQLNIPGQIIGALQMGPKIQNEDFLENGSNDFD
jgi:hypothetical protein